MHPLLLGAAAVMSLMLISGCGTEFSFSCKQAINANIDLREQAIILSGAPTGYCDGLSSRSDDVAALSATCAALQQAISNVFLVCDDSANEALEKVLLGERQL